VSLTLFSLTHFENGTARILNFEDPCYTAGETVDNRYLWLFFAVQICKELSLEVHRVGEGL
jgi:hypothetical protein